MALHRALLRAFLLALVLASLDLSTCHSLKGSVVCLDCRSHGDLSGIAVAVRCKHDMKQITTLTNDKGYFESELPSSNSSNCLARILGGPEQLFTYRKFMTSKIVKRNGSDYFLSTPLSFLSSCPKAENAKGENPKKGSEIGTSKTVHLPLPREWGLPPTSYYLPFVPIIGIP